jgi:hypothetical protein
MFMTREFPQLEHVPWPVLKWLRDQEFVTAVDGPVELADAGVLKMNTRCAPSQSTRRPEVNADSRR